MDLVLDTTNNKQHAALLYRPVRQWVAASGYVLTGASSIPQLVSRMLGMAARAAGLAAEATGHYETALQQAEEMHAATELTATCSWYAKHLSDQGDGERASRLLERARRVWDEADVNRSPQ